MKKTICSIWWWWAIGTIYILSSFAFPAEDFKGNVFISNAVYKSSITIQAITNAEFSSAPVQLHAVFFNGRGIGASTMQFFDSSTGTASERAVTPLFSTDGQEHIAFDIQTSSGLFYNKVGTSSVMIIYQWIAGPPVLPERWRIR